jgi:predicted ribosome quality control (RQC) complex YloA/Tae2 family protein
MYFDGTILRHVTKELNESILNGRINKIQESAQSQFFITIYNRKSYKLFISVASKHPRVHLMLHPIDHIQTVSQFTLALRKYFENGLIKSIKQIENDRILCLEVEKRNEIGDLKTNRMWIEIMGRHANLIITDNHNVILDAHKTILAFENNQRTIYPNVLYEPFPNNQLNPFDVDDRTHIDFTLPIYKTLQGLSPLIQKELSFRSPSIQKSVSILKSLLENPKFLYYSTSQLYSYMELKHLNNEVAVEFASVNKLLEHHYSSIDLREMVSDKHRDLITTVSKALIKHRNKLEHLHYDYQQTDSSDQFRVTGDLIQSNLSKIKKGMQYIDVFNYYTSKNERIELDIKKSPIENMHAAYKKAKKIKSSIPHIISQIEYTKMMIKYLEEIQSQIKFAGTNDILEIEEELRTNKILKQQQKQLKANKKNKRPNYKTILIEDSKILVGMNNIQNAFITHQIAKKHDVFFHVKHGPGAHVIVINTHTLTESIIRAAAHFAAYYSPQSSSSSVEVIYTEVKNIKKIKGQHGSNVIFSTYQSIFIDPDYKTVINLQNNKSFQSD